MSLEELKLLYYKKYKIYYCKKKVFLLEYNSINNMLLNIERILLDKYNFDDKNLLVKRFDKESIL